LAQFLWSEWRSEYVRHSEQSLGCFLCHPELQQQTADTLAVYHDQSVVVLLNRFPYNPGHLLIAPVEHIASLAECSPELVAHLFLVVRHVVGVAEPLFKAHGWNIGVNLGSAAGSGVPGHLHIHAVPRWEGDSNFMPVVSDVRVVSQRLESLWQMLRDALKTKPLE
jgi:ATP adenylyltransferase